MERITYLFIMLFACLLPHKRVTSLSRCCNDLHKFWGLVFKFCKEANFGGNYFWPICRKSGVISSCQNNFFCEPLELIPATFNVVFDPP